MGGRNNAQRGIKRENYINDKRRVKELQIKVS